jgi:hypothetical protein
MLPFTTYNIPENNIKETPSSPKWLWIITPHALSVPQEDLLKKIVIALKADFENDVFMQMIPEGTKFSLGSSTDSSPSLVVSFGVTPSSLGLWIDIPNKGIRFLENMTFILSPSLQELEQSPVSKKQLWSFMQDYLERNI